MVQLLGLCPIVTHVYVLARFGQAGFTSITATVRCQIVLASLAGMSHACVPCAELVHYLACSLLLGGGLAYLDCLLSCRSFLTYWFNHRWPLGGSEARRIGIQACKSVPCIVLLDRQVRKVMLERAKLSVWFDILAWPWLLMFNKRLLIVVGLLGNNMVNRARVSRVMLFSRNSWVAEVGLVLLLKSKLLMALVLLQLVLRWAIWDLVL